MEPHNFAIKADPSVHLAPADIADHVIDVFQAHRPRHTVFAFNRPKSWQKNAAVVLALNKRMDRITVRGDGGNSNLPVLVFECGRFLHATSAAPRSFNVRRLGVVHPESY